jgi:trehalose 6-phosphate synthase/phosphatase
VTDCSWKQIAQPVMKTYTETTDGSTIEDKETALVWNYEDADPDFGSCQAKELHDHLESVLANEPVSVKAGMNHVEVKPQVGAHICSSCRLMTVVPATLVTNTNGELFCRV